MLNVEHFRELIIRPTLEHLDMWSPAAENLVLGTGIKESSLCYLKQLGGGPALGLYQMEPATHDDIWANYLVSKKDISSKVEDFMAEVFTSLVEGDSFFGWARQLPGNLYYATAMCRIHYWRRPEPLPDAEDADAMGAYWKQWYNSDQGAGVPEDFARLFRHYVL